MITAVTRRLRDRRLAADAGTSLAELIIGMALMALFMAIFTGAVVTMAKTGNKVEAVSLSNSQTNQAFLRLDKTIRYATNITTPGVSTTGTWYVEIDTTNTGQEVCTQLKVNKATQQLQQRSWNVTNSVAQTASAWTGMASYITNGGAAVGSATAPFSTPPSPTGVSSPFQRLTITLVASYGNPQPTTNQTQMTFTALNTPTVAPQTTPCQQWGRP
jgi:hypothetical protein